MPDQRKSFSITEIGLQNSQSNRRRMAIDANGTCVSFCNQPNSILASPGLRGKFDIDEKRIQCLSKESQHVPIYLHRFPVIQLVSSKVRHFSTFWPPLGTPGAIAVNVTWMERGFNAGQTHNSIYPSLFNRLRAI